MNATRDFVDQMERELEPFVTQVATGPFVESILAGEFPLDGIRFVHTNHYHLLMNDMAQPEPLRREGP